jgi:hypothetical protein
VMGAVTVDSLGSVVESERTATLESEAVVQSGTAETLLFTLEEDAVSLADTTEQVQSSAVLEREAENRLVALYEGRVESKQIAAVHLVDPDEGTVIASSNDQVVGQSSTRLRGAVRRGRRRGDVPTPVER